jgi:hypothetical protein
VLFVRGASNVEMSTDKLYAKSQARITEVNKPKEQLVCAKTHQLPPARC